MRVKALVSVLTAPDGCVSGDTLVMMANRARQVVLLEETHRFRVLSERVH